MTSWQSEWEPLVRLALREDLGRAGDITSQAVFGADDLGRAEVRSRAVGVFSGAEIAAHLAAMVDDQVTVALAKHDGDALTKGDLILTLAGPTLSLLALERTLLNFICHLSGVATSTRAYAEAISGTGTKLLCTRKTTPGLRVLEKAAVRHGGGHNHRFGLDDGYMVKDNHIAAAGSIRQAVSRIRAVQHQFMRIEVEIDRLDQIEEAIDAGADILLLDNMPPAVLREALALVDGRVLTEASGGITLDTIREIAETGVDFVSVGALTRSAPSLDFGLDWTL